MDQSPRLPGALSRSRGALALATALLLVLAAGVWATVALAIPPGGPRENRPAGWVVSLDRKVVPSDDATYTNPGKVTFTVSGVPVGTVLNAKIDDGLVLPAAPEAGTDVFKVVTVPEGGAATGTIDLATAKEEFRNALRTGRHNVRLVGSGYSFRLDFVVRKDATINLAAGIGGSPGRTAVVGPGPDQPLAWTNLTGPYAFFPQLTVGSLIPYYAAGFAPGQVVRVQVDDGLPNPSPITGQPGTVWAVLRADADGAVRGLFDFPPVTGTGGQGSHWLRFLTGATEGGTAGSQYAPFAVKAPTSTRVLDVAASAQRGRALTFSGTGFVREPADYTPIAGTGQTLTARVDGTGPPIDVLADGAGVVSGSVPIPADTPKGVHKLVVYQGFRTESDYPEAVYERSFEVTEFVPDPVVTTPTETTPVVTTPTTTTPTTTTPVTPPTTTPKPRSAKVASTKLKATKTGRVSLSIARPSVTTKATVSVKTKSKVRAPGAKRKAIVTLVKAKSLTLKAGTAKGRTTVSLTLTKTARALLKRSGSLKVVVRVTPKGGKPFTKTLTLRG
jgi:hypothetical protein